jgi:hypothetical protein
MAIEWAPGSIERTGADRVDQSEPFRAMLECFPPLADADQSGSLLVFHFCLETGPYRCPACEDGFVLVIDEKNVDVLDWIAIQESCFAGAHIAHDRRRPVFNSVADRRNDRGNTFGKLQNRHI